MYTAISRKVVGKKCTRQSRKVLWMVLSSLFFKEFERVAREAMDLYLRVLKESNKSRFDSYSVRNSVLLISLITFRDCRVHIFPTAFLEIAVYTHKMSHTYKHVYVKAMKSHPVPFMHNFRSLPNKFPSIFCSLIFHISLPRLG